MRAKDLILLIFILLPFFLAGCSGTGGGGGGVGNLHGTVVDLSYAPVSNADVVVDTVSTKTLSNGTYTFTNLPSGDKVIRITSAAHTPSYRKVTFSGGTTANAGIAIVAALDGKITPITQSAGGTATNTNGSIKMNFPINSVPGNPTNVILTNVPKVAAPYDPPEGDQFISYIVYAKPENTTLAVSAEISVPNLTGVTTEPVGFYHFNTDTLTWQQFGIGHASAETQTIDVNSPFMGWIAAIIPINPLPGSISGVVKDSSTSVPIVAANVWTQTSYAVSDNMGQYTLQYVPTGNTTVFASALDYHLFSISPVSVTTMHTTPLNISLNPVGQGNISGTVQKSPFGNLENARVTETNGGVAFTDQFGRYTLYNVPVGTTNVTAYADSCVSSTDSSVPVTNGGTSTANFFLPFVGTAPSYEFTFNVSDEGFTAEAGLTGKNFWHRQTYDSVVLANNPQNYFNSAHAGGVTQKVYLKDNGVDSIDSRIPKPYGGSSAYFWYGQTSQAGDPATSEASYIGIEASDDTFEGSGGISSAAYGDFGANAGSLESPALDLTRYTFGNLSFWTWWEIEGKNPKQSSQTGKDWMVIYVSKSPYSTWDLLGYLNPYDDPRPVTDITGEAYTSGGFNQPGIWVNHTFDLTPYAGHIIKIRFLFNTADNLWNGYRGWFIDDVKINNSQFGISSFTNHGIKCPPPSRLITPRN